MEHMLIFQFLIISLSCFKKKGKKDRLLQINYHKKKSANIVVLDFHTYQRGSILLTSLHLMLESPDIWEIRIYNFSHFKTSCLLCKKKRVERQVNN